MTAISVPPLGDSSSSFPRSECSSDRDHEDHRDDEVDELHDFVKCGHRALEEINEQRDDRASNERSDKRPEMASMQEPSSGLGRLVVGMRLTHADNLNFGPAP